MGEKCIIMKPEDTRSVTLYLPNLTAERLIHIGYRKPCLLFCRFEIYFLKSTDYLESVVGSKYSKAMSPLSYS